MTRFFETEGQVMYVTPVTYNEILLNDIPINNIVCLYQFEESEAINVGMPALMSYMPNMANMFGFDKAKNKSYFYVISEDEINEYYNVPVFKIYLTGERTVNKESSMCINSIDVSIMDAVIEREEVRAYFMPKQKELTIHS